MIASLTGRLVRKSPSQAVIDVQGVGYELFIPLSTYCGLPDIAQVTNLHVQTCLRDDAIQLFGFLTEPEKAAFGLLTTVSGIGPKLALSVLSTFTIPNLAEAVQAGDIDRLATVPGIGAGPGPEGTAAEEGLSQPFPGKSGFKLMHVANGRALIEDASGMYIVRIGSVLPDNTRLATLEQRDGHWVMITSSGEMYQAN